MLRSHGKKRKLMKEQRESKLDRWKPKKESAKCQTTALVFLPSFFFVA